VQQSLQIGASGEVGRGISGQMGVTIVRKTGQITDVQVSRSVHPLLDEEAMRVVRSMPKWIPANFRGQAVSTPYELFIYFKGVK
jgi:protein TonB